MNLLLLLFLKCKKWFETNKNCPTICFRKHKIIYLKGIDLRHMTLVEKYISCLSLFSFTFLFLPDNTLKNLKFETGNRGVKCVGQYQQDCKTFIFLVPCKLSTYSGNNVFFSILFRFQMFALFLQLEFSTVLNGNWDRGYVRRKSRNSVTYLFLQWKVDFTKGLT